MYYLYGHDGYLCMYIILIWDEMDRYLCMCMCIFLLMVWMYGMYVFVWYNVCNGEWTSMLKHIMDNKHVCLTIENKYVWLNTQITKMNMYA